MGAHEEQQDELAEFQPDPMEQLTIQDALIICAVYAVAADGEKCQQISELAQKHPLFEEDPKDTRTRVNMFTNMMQIRQPLRAVEAVARQFKRKQRKQAFDFAVEVAMTHDGPMEKKQKILYTLAARLGLEDEFAARRLAKSHSKDK